jgi:hypothetical protein
VDWRRLIGLVFWVHSLRYWTTQRKVSVLRGRERFTQPPRGVAATHPWGNQTAFSDPCAKAIRDRAARLADDRVISRGFRARSLST